MKLEKRLWVGALVISFVLGSADVFAQPRLGERDRVIKDPASRGLLEGIDISHFKDLRIVEEDVPPGARTIILLNDEAKGRGRVAAHVAEVFVYKNFSAGRNNQTAFFFNWATTSGGSGDPDCPGGIAEDCFTPAVTVPGIFQADGAVFGGGFKAGKTAVTSYEILAFRSSSDPDTQDLAFVEMELWDGDPLNAFDSTGIGFSAAPIPGTQVTFSGVPVNTKIVFRGELDPPVVTPHSRVWVVVTSDACRFGWVLSRNAPEVGADDHERLNALTGLGTGLFEFQLDTDGETNGNGICCGDDCDGAACDYSIGLVCCDDPNGSRNQCVDGDAEDMTLGFFGGTRCSGDPRSPTDACSNFWLNVLAEAEVTMSLVPTGNGALGALVDGARIEGNEIIMVAGGENVMMDLQLSNFAPDPNPICVGGANDGMPCSRANEVADCGAVDPFNDAFGCGVKLSGCTSDIDTAGFTSGITGVLNRMNMSCTTDADCITAFGGACSISGGLCAATSECPDAGPPLNEVCRGGINGGLGSFCNAGKCLFAYFTQSRADYIFRGLDVLVATETTPPEIRWGGHLNGPAISPPDPFPAGGLNVAQLNMTTSADAKGTFTLGFKPAPFSNALDARGEMIDLVGMVPAKITVAVGQCCNLDAEPAVGVTDQVTAAGCAAMAIDNGFETLFDPSKTCANECMTCFPAVAPMPEPIVIAKNRYLSFTSGNPGHKTAFKVTFVDLPPPHNVANGRSMWVGPPETIVEHNGNRDPAGAPGFATFLVARLQCDPFVTDWGSLGTISVYHEGIIPGAAYEVREVGGGCSLDDEANLSGPLQVVTSRWGDLVGNCMMTPCSPPNGTVDVVFDAVSIIDKLRNVPGALTKTRVDIDPNRPDQLINILEVTRTLDAFAGARYPFAGPGAIDPCAP